MTALKDIYTTAFYQSFIETAQPHIPALDLKKFIKAIFDESWQQMELKERIRHTTKVLHKFMPDNFNEAAILLCKIAADLQKNNSSQNLFGYMFLPDYIEQYGIANYKASIKAIENITQFVSCEYAIRPFIIKYPQEAINQMLGWSKHKNQHVRRLASEGMRPSLPWAMALPAFKKNPEPILPILENLKADSSDYVRRSVANNLNDISKDNPQVVLALAKKWKGKNELTDCIIKHGCRTLLKQGNIEILKLYALQNSAKINVSQFNLQYEKIQTGTKLPFAFSIVNRHTTKQNIRVEYAIYFMLKNGTHYKKIFKITEGILNAGEARVINKAHNFKLITTRQYYTGKHYLGIIINGTEKVKTQFVLI
ncbi:MAG: DNA alkylation repair protein [Bacteroidia bacterium]|nr:DNA alkylation repair protein [Bacteroidia bacterium]